MGIVISTIKYYFIDDNTVKDINYDKAYKMMETNYCEPIDSDARIRRPEVKQKQREFLHF